MRLVSIATPEGPVAGLLRDGRIFRVRAAPEASLLELLRAGLPNELEPAEGEGTGIAEVELLPPLGHPGKILCIGLNYLGHAEESGNEPPETPTFFAKFANALRPAGATVELPRWSSKVDYEAEVAFVIGDRCKDVPAEDAIQHVAGYMLFNDLSARDYQFKTPQWMPGKTFDGAAPCGPALVTPDEAGPHDAIGIELRLNGELMQQSSTADLVHSIPDLVAYLSMLMTLEPGDVVATGTPEGVGSRRDPRVWLKAGDEVVVSSPQLGELRTLIA
jgi:2-keto-4-pentenoate hydratase/2-oxohepta-3-ene-1,7-dioic acid hydratase in catechol pathway